MKILRFLLCHLLSVILLVSFVLIFLSRDVLKDDYYSLTGKVSLPVANETNGNSSEIEKNNEITQKLETVENPAVITTHPEASAVVAPAIENSVNLEPVVEPAAVVEPVNAGSEKVADNTEATQPAGATVSQKESDDPWDTVLAGVKEGNVATAEFGSDIQVEADPVEESATVASFPPDNYDPELSGTTLSENTQKSAASTGFPIIASQNLPAEQSSENSSLVQDSAPAQGLSTLGSEASKQLPADQAYYSALEEARRMHWDGNAKSAQAAFERLMFDYPAMPEAPADLGNLFLQQGNREGAIWAYQNAIPRYLNLHREQEAINLTRFVSQYDPAIAESLQKKYW